MVSPTTVNGKRSGHDIMLYALSTCVWCNKTKKLLDTLGFEYRYLWVDKLSGRNEDEVMDEVRKFNPECTFPTLVVDGQKCIVGFREPEIRKALS